MTSTGRPSRRLSNATRTTAAGSTGWRGTKRVHRSLGVGSDHRSAHRDHRGDGAAARRVGPEAQAVGGRKRKEPTRVAAGGEQDVSDNERLGLVAVAECPP